MKKELCLILVMVVAAALLGAEGQYETVGALKSLPSEVQDQSRYGVELPANWESFDKSGDVKFLQVQTTASASPSGTGSMVDGSRGERIVEIQAEPGVTGNEVEWALKNKGPNPVWVVAGGMSGPALNLRLAGGASSDFKMALDGSRYTYIVVDNEGGGTTQLDIKAKIGDTEAKTSRGASMVILWF